MPIFDTHTHYDDEQFNEDRDALIRSLPEHGIGTIMNVCASVRSLDRIVPMTRQYEHVYGAAGVHPDYADEITQEVLDKLRSILAEPEILAVGRSGSITTGTRKRRAIFFSRKLSGSSWISPGR